MHAGVQVLPFFLYSRKLRSLLYKSAPRGSLSSEKKFATEADRHRRVGGGGGRERQMNIFAVWRRVQ